MSGFQRYAIYHVPDDPELAGFGAKWLGWDIVTGGPVARPVDAGDPSVVASPRKYGFHGTLKPPFRLSEGKRVEELASDQGELPQQLSAEGASSDIAKFSPDEPGFRYELNADAMATEKLAEGIRNFVADQVKLEQLISER